MTQVVESLRPSVQTPVLFPPQKKMTSNIDHQIHAFVLYMRKLRPGNGMTSSALLSQQMPNCAKTQYCRLRSMNKCYNNLYIELTALG
jgi:hypothetical protein